MTPLRKLLRPSALLVLYNEANDDARIGSILDLQKLLFHISQFEGFLQLSDASDPPNRCQHAETNLVATDASYKAHEILMISLTLPSFNG